VFVWLTEEQMLHEEVDLKWDEMEAWVQDFQLLEKFRADLVVGVSINHLTPKGHFSGRTTPLTYRCCFFLFIQQIYVLNILNMLHTLLFFSLQNAVYFIMLPFLVPVFTF
jgi:hypothetical protein